MYYIDSSVNIPLPLDQHHILGVAKWRQGGRWRGEAREGKWGEIGRVMQDSEGRVAVFPHLHIYKLTTGRDFPVADKLPYNQWQLFLDTNTSVNWSCATLTLVPFDWSNYIMYHVEHTTKHNLTHLGYAICDDSFVN